MSTPIPLQHTPACDELHEVEIGCAWCGKPIRVETAENDSSWDLRLTCSHQCLNDLREHYS
jgi:hypothetical protein